MQQKLKTSKDSNCNFPGRYFIMGFILVKIVLPKIVIFTEYPSQHLLVQNEQWKHHSNV